MNIENAIQCGAEIACATVMEKGLVLDILGRKAARECFKGIGAPDGLIIILFPDGTYMIDNEPAGSVIVTGEEVICAAA